MPTRLYTIGFTRKSARQFFDALQRNGVKRLIDIRLNNTSQLAGFTKKEDLAYLAEAVAGIEYRHMPELGPSQAVFDGLKKHKGSWADYERQFEALLRERRAIERLDRSLFDTPSCLLCTEPTAEQCHRRLVGEAIQARWPDIELAHL